MDLYLVVLWWITKNGFRLVISMILAGVLGGVIMLVVQGLISLTERVVDTATNSLCSFRHHQKRLNAITYIIAVALSFPLFIATWTWIGDQIDKSSERYKFEAAWRKTDTRIEEFILVSIRPPKHVYVTLKHARTNTVYEDQYVGKHCNAYRNNVIGTTYNIRYDVYTHDQTKQTKIVFQSLSDVFCN